MNEELSTAEQRLLWLLVANPDGEFESVLKLSKAKPIREALARAGLVDVEKRIKSSKSKRKVQSTYLRLTDAGWAWCNRNMSWTKPRGKAENFLNALLQRLGVLFERQAPVSSLADFVNASTLEPTQPTNRTEVPTEAAEPQPTPRAMSLDGRIRAACLELGGGREAVRIRIADLRKQLSDIPFDDLTEWLRELSRRRELTLYPLDDPRQILPEDEDAAILSSTGVPQHILYYGGIAS